MKPFKVLAKDHTGAEAQALLNLAISKGAVGFDYVVGELGDKRGEAGVFGIDYQDCYEFGVDDENMTFVRDEFGVDTDEPLLPYHKAVDHILAGGK